MQQNKMIYRVRGELKQVVWGTVEATDREDAIKQAKALEFKSREVMQECFLDYFGVDIACPECNGAGCHQCDQKGFVLVWD